MPSVRGICDDRRTETATCCRSNMRIWRHHRLRKPSEDPPRYAVIDRRRQGSLSLPPKTGCRCWATTVTGTGVGRRCRALHYFRAGNRGLLGFIIHPWSPNEASTVGNDKACRVLKRAAAMTANSAESLPGGCQNTAAYIGIAISL